MDAGLANAERGALAGFVAWIFFVAALAGWVLLIKAGPAITSARQWVKSATGRMSELSRSVGETAALRAEVRQAELLARKAAAEARLKRSEPDVIQHELRLHQKSD